MINPTPEHAMKPVAIVVGDLPHADFLRPFLEVLGHDRVTIFAHEALRHRLSALPGIKIVYMAKVEDLVGYMEGLEQQLEPFSAIMTTDLYSVSTFQVLNYTEKNGKSFVAINCYKNFDFLAGARNLQVILNEVLRKADQVFSFVAMSIDSKVFGSTLAERIILVPPFLNPIDSSEKLRRRRKFRTMLNLSETDRVLLLLASEEGSLGDIRGLLRALADLNEMHRSSGGWRLVLCDPYRRHEAVKYQAFECGLGKSALFLNQNPERFWSDLLCAADYYLIPSLGYTETGCYPFRALDAYGHGLVLLQQGQRFPELNDFCLLNHCTTTADWRQCLEALPSIPENHKGCAVSGKIEKKQAAFAKEVLGQLSSEGRATFHQAQRWLSVVNDFESLYKTGQITDDLMVNMHEFLKIQDMDDALRKRVYCLLGLVKERQSDFIAAIESFEACLQIDPLFVEALRGIGALALKTQSYDEALAFYKKLLSVKPDDAGAALGVGQIYARLGMLTEAVAWLEKAALNPSERGRALLNLVHLLNTAKASPFVEQIYQRLMDAYGTDKNLLIGYSRYLNENGQSQESHKILKQLQMAS